MEKVALVPRSLVHLHLDAMSIGPRVLTDTGHLPGNLDVRLVGLDGKAAIRDFRTNDRSRKLADDGELIAEVRIESFKPRGHRYDRRATAIGEHRTVVNVHHVRRFHEGVVEILVGRIERVIDLKGAAGLGDTAADHHIAIELPGNKGTLGVNSISPVSAFSAIGLNGIAAGILNV